MYTAPLTAIINKKLSAVNGNLPKSNEYSCSGPQYDLFIFTKLLNVWNADH